MPNHHGCIRKGIVMESDMRPDQLVDRYFRNVNASPAVAANTGMYDQPMLFSDFQLFIIDRIG